MKWWALYLLVLVLAAVIGYAIVTSPSPIGSSVRGLIESIIRELREIMAGQRITAEAIFIHNLRVAVVAVLPYAVISLVTRNRVVRVILALIPLTVIVFNGFVLGIVYGFLKVDPLYSSTLHIACGGSIDIIILSLILPHGIPEVLGLTAIASAPATLELDGARKRSIALFKLVFGLAALAVAAYIEVNITPYVAVDAVKTYCQEPLASIIAETLKRIAG